MTNKNDDLKNKSSAEINKPVTQKADQGSDAAGDSTNVASPPPVPNPRQEGEQHHASAPQLTFRPSAPPMPLAPIRASQASPGGRGSGGSSRGGKGVASDRPMIVAGGGILVGGGTEACSGAAVLPDVPSGSRPLKRKSEVVAPTRVKPICCICHRDFCSFKALFGHMRCHPDRQWRGCFPPPVVQAYEEIILAFPQPVAQQEERHGQENLHALTGAGASNVEAAEGMEQPARVARGLDIDLNEPMEPVIDFNAAETLTREIRDGSCLTDIDINKIPPSEDEDNV